MKNLFTALFNLHEGEEDKKETLENVKSSISFKGSNLWILSCAIIVASVGLNVNSTAVIIGAMLISPLMGPIVGAGFALGLYDFTLLKKSLKNLLIATIVSLAVATGYFYLSPFKEVQSELLARTSPNIYDVLIAFFGGLVGVIALTRVEKGNPIPGVAIATALMPPLCTAGYGLATGNLKFFVGALFLYSINCVFICIATFIIVKYLKYPAATHINTRYHRQVKIGITAIVLMVLVPSAYFAFSLYKEQQFKQLANDFIDKEFTDKGNTLVYKKINYAVDSNTIELAFLKRTYTQPEVKEINKKLANYKLPATRLIIRQNSSDNLLSFKNDILNEVSKKDNALTEKDQRITDLEKKLDKNTPDNKQLLAEMKVFFPGMQRVSLSQQNMATADSVLATTMLVYSSTPGLHDTEKGKLRNWLLKKLNITNIVIAETEN